MKILLPTLLASFGLLALAGCADNQTHVVSQASSAAMSTDPKNMSSSSMTTGSSTDIAPASTQSGTSTQTDTESSEPSYTAIHSNGQG
jgi:uncharacterized lipoprotein YajG